MIDPNNIPAVAGDELLARYITQRQQFRPSDQSVKPDLFIPFRLTKLSVTRHRDAMVDELWHLGRDVAALRQQTLYGRSERPSIGLLDRPLIGRCRSDFASRRAV